MNNAGHAGQAAGCRPGPGDEELPQGVIEEADEELEALKRCLGNEVFECRLGCG